MSPDLSKSTKALAVMQVLAVPAARAAEIPGRLKQRQGPRHRALVSRLALDHRTQRSWVAGRVPVMFKRVRFLLSWVALRLCQPLLFPRSFPLTD